MTAGSHTKMLKQLSGKPAKLKKYEKFNVPKKRTTGVNTSSAGFAAGLADMSRHTACIYAGSVSGIKPRCLGLRNTGR